MDNRILLPVFAAFCVVGCAAAQPDTDVAAITPDILLAGLPDRPRSLQFADSPVEYADEDVLRLDVDMRAFLAQHVEAGASNYVKLDQLVRALISDGAFGLVYEDRTWSAAETFGRRAGNCLSFTNLFVALARETGLTVSYQEVDIPPDWTERNGTFTLNRHVNVQIDLGAIGYHVVDFNIDDFRTSYERRLISDERALAHFFNNKGVEALQRGDTASAFANLKHALTRDPEFAPAWSNLGTLYRRQGLWSHAEASYLQALAVNRSEYVAISNLASLYAERGDMERSARFERRASLHRMRNPYYRFGLAREAFRGGDFDSAIGHLRYAVRRKPQEDSFHFLLGLSYLQKGDTKRARRWLDQAEELAQTDALKRNYRSKIDLLLSSGEEG